MKIFELDRRISTIKNKDFDALYNDMKINCSHALLSLQKGSVIYKGIKDLPEDVHLTDPTKRKRKSINTTNFYTMLFDNLPSWQNYPKRSRSLICTTDDSYASDYGNVHIVLPFNGAKIGVCSANDIWSGFKEAFKDSDNVKFLNDFNKEIYSLFFNKKYENNYNKFMIELCADNPYGTFRKGSILANTLSRKWSLGWAEIEKARTVEQVINVFNNRLSPTNNGFTLEIIGYDLPAKREVWTDSKSYLINVNSEFYKLLKQKMAAPV